MFKITVTEGQGQISYEQADKIEGWFVSILDDLEGRSNEFGTTRRWSNGMTPCSFGGLFELICDPYEMNITLYYTESEQAKQYVPLHVENLTDDVESDTKKVEDMLEYMEDYEIAVQNHISAALDVARTVARETSLRSYAISDTELYKQEGIVAGFVVVPEDYNPSTDTSLTDKPLLRVLVNIADEKQDGPFTVGYSEGTILELVDLSAKQDFIAQCIDLVTKTEQERQEIYAGA